MSRQLLEKYQKNLKGQVAKPTHQDSELQSKNEAKAHINPFAKTANNLDRANETPSLPRMTSTELPFNRFESLKSYNANSEFVRFTTEVFPTLTAFSNVNFPLACFLKPYGSSVF